MDTRLFVGASHWPYDFILFLILMMVLLAVWVATYRVRRDQRNAQWPAIAERLGLAFDGEHIVGERANGASVRVSMKLESQGRSQVYCAVLTLTHPRLPTELALGCQSNVSGPYRKDGPDFQTGDARFDNGIAISGTLAWRTALLSEGERALVRDAFYNRWTLSRGELQSVVPLSSSSSIEALVAEGDSLIDALVDRDDSVVRLVERAKTGPDETRLVAWDVLDAMYRDRPERGVLVEALLRDPSPVLRVRAACVVGDLEVLSESALSSTVDPAVRATAIRQLALHPEAPRVVATIAELAAAGPAPEVAAAVASALSRVPLPDAEAVLVRLLDGASDATVEAVVTSLAAIGTRACLPSLLALAEGDSRHRRPARTVARRIQERAGDHAGGLALADAGGGELSLSAEE
ncbi:MAG: HEAT repeat domain-containing protein [Myxococcota bacterium]